MAAGACGFTADVVQGGEAGCDHVQRRHDGVRTGETGVLLLFGLLMVLVAVVAMAAVGGWC